MPAHRYMEENGLAAMLATKRSGSVTPEVNLREHVTCMPPPSVNKAGHSGFEKQKKPSPEVQNRGINGPTKRLMSSKNFKKSDKHHSMSAF